MSNTLAPRPARAHHAQDHPTRAGRARVVDQGDDVIDVEGGDTSAFPAPRAGCGSCSRSRPRPTATSRRPRPATGPRTAQERLGQAEQHHGCGQGRDEQGLADQGCAGQEHAGQLELGLELGERRATRALGVGTTRSASGADLAGRVTQQSDRWRRARAAVEWRHHHGVGGDDRSHHRRGVGCGTRRIGCRRGRRRVRGARGAEERFPRPPRQQRGPHPGPREADLPGEAGGASASQPPGVVPTAARVADPGTDRTADRTAAGTARSTRFG